MQRRVPSGEELRAAAQTLAGAGAAKGGHVRATRLTPGQRQEIARKAGRARWANRPLPQTPREVVTPRNPSEGNTPTGKDLRAAAQLLGAPGATKGGHARAAKLTPEQRREIPRKAGVAGAKARWDHRPEQQTPAGAATREITRDRPKEESGQPRVIMDRHATDESASLSDIRSTLIAAHPDRQPSQRRAGRQEPRRAENQFLPDNLIGERDQACQPITLLTWRRLLPLLRGLRDQPGSIDKADDSGRSLKQ